MINISIIKQNTLETLKKKCLQVIIDDNSLLRFDLSLLRLSVSGVFIFLVSFLLLAFFFVLGYEKSSKILLSASLLNKT